jgi:hypothetical protein
MKQLIMKNQLINTEMLLENYLNFEEKLPRKLVHLQDDLSFCPSIGAATSRY